MHFHSPQRLPFYPHRPHTRRHVYPGLLWLPQMLAIPSSFDPAIHPTISDLAVLDDETISYTIKQSKTDQTKKGHFIYIFKTPIAFITIPNPPSFPPPKEITVQTPIRPPLHRRLQPPRHSLLVPKAPQGSPAPIRYPSRKLFQPFIPNRRSNHSGPQRPFPTADPRTRSLVVRGFQSYIRLNPLPHQGSPPDPNRPSPLEYTPETPQQPLLSIILIPPPPTQLFFPTAAAVPAPAGAFSVFPPLPQQCLLPKEPFLYFPSTAAVTAPAGALSVFHHYTTAVVTAPLRSATCISPLPQQWLLPQERYLYSLTAAAVLAPTGAFSSPPPPHPNRFSPTAAAVPAPAGAFSVFPPLPQQCLLPKEPFLYFPSTQQWLLQQERYLYFITTAVVTAPLRSATCISPLPQQWLLPQEPSLLPPPPPLPPYQPSSSLPQ